uniref:Neur_chan_memb domain-containing protein n=1 Tax=Strongyloides papillosus TaxID=174720 RepID=A0A0N5BDI6_STREA
MGFIVLSIVILIKDDSTTNVAYSSISVNKFIFVALVIALFAMLYTEMVNCFTYHFVKRSFETGYSISAARPFAQPSGSISEHHRNSRDNSPFDFNIDQGNRIELTSRNQERSLDDNVIAKRNHTSSHNQIQKVLPLMYLFYFTLFIDTANRLPER